MPQALSARSAFTFISMSASFEAQDALCMSNRIVRSGATGNA